MKRKLDIRVVLVLARVFWLLSEEVRLRIIFLFLVDSITYYKELLSVLIFYNAIFIKCVCTCFIICTLSLCAIS